MFTPAGELLLAGFFVAKILLVVAKGCFLKGGLVYARHVGCSRTSLVTNDSQEAVPLPAVSDLFVVRGSFYRIYRLTPESFCNNGD